MSQKRGAHIFYDRKLSQPCTRKRTRRPSKIAHAWLSNPGAAFRPSRPLESFSLPAAAELDGFITGSSPGRPAGAGGPK